MICLVNTFFRFTIAKKESVSIRRCMSGCKEIRGRFMMRRSVLDGGKWFINWDVQWWLIVKDFSHFFHIHTRFYAERRLSSWITTEIHQKSSHIVFHSQKSSQSVPTHTQKSTGYNKITHSVVESIVKSHRNNWWWKSRKKSF